MALTLTDLLKLTIIPMLNACEGNYVNEQTRQYLEAMKAMGVYSGRTVGTIDKLKREWEDEKTRDSHHKATGKGLLSAP